MTPPFVNISQTAIAALAAAASIWLALFVVPGAGVQGRPLPLLPAIGEAAGVIAPPAAPARPAATAPRRAVVPAQVVARQTRPPQPASAARRPPLPVVRPPAPARAPAPIQAPAETTVVAQQATQPPMGKALARGHSKAPVPLAAVGTKGRGHGKAKGHSAAHHQGGRPGHDRGSTARPAPLKSPADHGADKHGGGKR
jgi:hypothetical protein